jgi:hypothetical protein
MDAEDNTEDDAVMEDTAIGEDVSAPTRAPLPSPRSLFSPFLGSLGSPRKSCSNLVAAASRAANGSARPPHAHAAPPALA